MKTSSEIFSDGDAEERGDCAWCKQPSGNAVLCAPCLAKRAREADKSAAQCQEDSRAWGIFRDQWWAGSETKRKELERRFLGKFPWYSDLFPRWRAHVNQFGRTNKPEGKGRRKGRGF